MGASEAMLAAFVRTHLRKEVMLSTKFTPQIAVESADPVADMCAASLERFGTDYIDLYWIHNPHDVEKWTPHLIPLLQSGKVRRVGVSNHNLAWCLASGVGGVGDIEGKPVLKDVYTLGASIS